MTARGDLIVETVTNGPFVENCYIIADQTSRQAILIDPGDEPARILAAIRRLEVQVTLVLATHGHVDHVAAAPPILEELGVDFAMHPADREWLGHMREQCLAFGLPPRDGPSIDRELADGDEIRVGNHMGRVIHTPGHTPGGVSLYFANDKAVFAGDTLFAGSIGRTDLPGGSKDDLLAAIRDRILPLGDDVTLYPGHGATSTLGQERRANPFLRPGVRWL